MDANERIDPVLLQLLDDIETEGAEVIETYCDRYSVSMGDTPMETCMGVLLTFSSDETAASFSRSGEGRGTRSAGRVVALQAYPADLPNLAKVPGLLRIALGRRSRPKMDVAAPFVGVPQYRQTHRLSGHGVVIGIVDTGIDATHPCFANRIIAIWDQMDERGPPPVGFDYGSELVKGAVSRGTDEDGHGTHVAGIAAGGHRCCPGVAPEAQLVVVKSDLGDDEVVQGVQYIFGKAAALGLPAVVNLSLGHLDHSHDGTDSYSTALDSLSGSGRIICCAAGNEAEDPIRAALTVSPPRVAEVPFRVRVEQGGTVVLVGWCSEGRFVEVGVRKARKIETDFHSPAPGKSRYGKYCVGGWVIIVRTPGRDPCNGDYQIRIELRRVTQGTPHLERDWAVVLRAPDGKPVNVNLWFPEGGEDDPIPAFDAKCVTNGMRVNAPGCAKTVVTVGSFTTRATWTTRTERAARKRRMDYKSKWISPFSSDGPLRDGTLKPDVAAPGAMIISARSSQADANSELDIDAERRIMGGTSMAAPFVAGVVALVLQQNPTADPRSVLSWLRQSGQIPRKAGGAYHPKWGYGLIRLL